MKIKYLIIVLSAVLIGLTIYFALNRYSCNTSFIPIERFENAQITCNKNMLVTFDVDHTLIIAQDALAQQKYMPFLFKIIALYRYPSLRNLTEFEHVTSLVFDQAPQQLTEKNAPHFINNLKDQGCTVVGLTAMDTGSWGVIKNTPAWRYTMLKNMGINFSTMPNYVFNDIKSHRRNYPELYNGILCANQQPKGTVLEAFIDLQKNKPTQIVSFDDDQKALCSIAQMCKERNITFVGYHYKGAEALTKPFSYRRALMQLDNLMKNQVWLGDDQIESLDNVMIKK